MSCAQGWGVVFAPRPTVGKDLEAAPQQTSALYALEVPLVSVVVAFGVALRYPKSKIGSTKERNYNGDNGHVGMRLPFMLPQ